MDNRLVQRTCPDCDGKGVARAAQNSAWPFRCVTCKGIGSVEALAAPTSALTEPPGSNEKEAAIEELREALTDLLWVTNTDRLHFSTKALGFIDRARAVLSKYTP